MVLQGVYHARQEVLSWWWLLSPELQIRAGLFSGAVSFSCPALFHPSPNLSGLEPDTIKSIFSISSRDGMRQRAANVNVAMIDVVSSKALIIPETVPATQAMTRSNGWTEARANNG